MIAVLKSVFRRPDRDVSALLIEERRAAAVARGELEVYGVDEQGEIVYRQTRSWAP